MHGQRRFRIPSPAWFALVASAFALAACTGGSGATASPTAAAPVTPSAATSPAGPVTVAMGTFHDVDGTASGTAALKHLADDSFAVVFEDFSIASSAHTNVVLVPVEDVTATGDVDKSAILDLGPLKGTSGMQDFPVPSSADAMGFHTVVLWDTEMEHAIAAAPLR
ncbi:MAG: DM13 domain-containing protein [Chloroflexota bacterium]|nr:DM13 domain-containing protein [Chloroflexota bacterium]